MATIKTVENVQRDPALVKIAEVNLNQSTRVMLIKFGIKTLKELFEALVTNQGDMTSFVFKFDGVDLHPFNQHMSDSVELLLSSHPATKDQFAQMFEISSVKVDVDGDGTADMVTMLRQGVNSLLDAKIRFPVIGGTRANGKSSK